MMRLTRRRPALFALILLSAAVHAAMQTAAVVRLRAERSTIQRTIAAAQRDRQPRPVDGTSVESRIQSIAKAAGVRQLTAVSVSDGAAGAEINLEWRSRPAEALAMIGGLSESIERLTLSAADDGWVRGRLTASARALPPSFDAPASTQPASARDVFKPLWKNPPSAAHQTAWNLRRQEAERKREQERIEAERREREIASALDAKKRHYQTGFALTGIVNNGRENVAFVDSLSGVRRSVMLKQGDRIDEARVARIDSQRGEMELDCAGQFSVTLKIGVMGGS